MLKCQVINKQPVSFKYEIPPSQIRSAFPIYKALLHKTKSEYLFLQGLGYDGM